MADKPTRSAAQKAATRRMVAANRAARRGTSRRSSRGTSSPPRRKSTVEYHSVTGTGGAALVAFGVLGRPNNYGPAIYKAWNVGRGPVGNTTHALSVAGTILNPLDASQAGSSARNTAKAGVALIGGGILARKWGPARRMLHKLSVKIDRKTGISLIPKGR